MAPGVDQLEAADSVEMARNINDILADTTSGFNVLPPFLNLLMEVGVDRIMLSADYPLASMTEAHTFLNQLPISPTDREKIAYGNAETLMGI